MFRFEIRIPYAPSATLAAAFPDAELIQVHDAEALLVGELEDQSELRTVLDHIDDLGLQVIEFRRAAS